MTIATIPAAVGVQMVPLASLHASSLNPRKRFDDASLDELAESIATEGLLQNLVVRPSSSDPEKFEIAAGERRLRAMLRLDNAGRWPRDRLVPVVVRDLTDLQLLQLATTENLARADMTPMEEARAFARMLELGSDVETIALETGLSERTVKLRLTLVQRLARQAIEMLEAGELNLSQAQALTAGSDETQARILRIRNYHGTFVMPAAAIRQNIAWSAIPVSRARFPLTQYQGSFTEPSIFDPDGEATFDDVDQFHRLQEAWKDKLAAGYEKTWGWVHVVEDYAHWLYETPDGKEHLAPKDLGVVIEHKTDGTLTVHEGLKRREEPSASSTAGKPERDPLALSKKHKAVIHEHLERAAQAAIAGKRTPALALLIFSLLKPYGTDAITIGTTHLGQAPNARIKNLHPAARAHLDTLELGSATRQALTGDRYAPGTDEELLADLMSTPDASLSGLLGILVGLSLRAGERYGGGRLEPVFAAIWRHLVDEYEMSDHLPTWRELGADWLQMYPKARLEQLHADATGLEPNSNLTRNNLAAGILDHAKPGWLDQVPDDLQLPDTEPEAAGVHWTDGEPPDVDEDGNYEDEGEHWLEETQQDEEREFNQAEYPDEYDDEPEEEEVDE